MSASHPLIDRAPSVGDEYQYPPSRAGIELDHVIVVVLRNSSSQPIGWLGRFSGANRIRQDDEIFGYIQRLARSEQFARECGRQEISSRTAGSMQDQHGLSTWLANRSVMQAQFGHNFARVKPKVPRNPVALLRCWVIRSRRPD